MKKVVAFILTLCLLLCPLGVSAAAPEIKTAYAHAKLLNFGEFPEKPEYEAGIATASIPQYNSAAGVTVAADKNPLQEIHKYLRDCFINCESDISLYDYGISVNPNAQANDPPDDLNIIFTETINYYPELFNVYSAYQYSYAPTEAGYIAYSLTPIYVNPDDRTSLLESQEIYNAALEKYNNEIEQIISGISPEMTDLEKALYVHDYLVTHFQYDTSYTYYDAYSFFKLGVGVCQAYTQTFNAIMHRLGIECTSAIDEPDNHTWNIITLDGKSYHIDATQDDPVYSNDGTLINQSEGAAEHSFFLLSDDTIKNDDSHTEWYSAMYDTSCTDTTYESGYAWNKADSSFEYVDGKWYFIAYDSGAVAKLYSTDNFKQNTSVCEISLYNSTQTTYYPVYYGGITSFGNVLYYTTPFKIYSYDTVSGKQKDTGYSSENYISSCRYDGTEEDGYFALTVFYGSHPAYGDLPGSTKKLAKIGDTDGDGKISSTDITNTKKLLIGAETDFNWATIDFGNKKQVSILDLVKIKKLAATA
ncbi:MAG: transglutaminase domain-containing protein [Acutalibacteraceae bacterium]